MYQHHGGSIALFLALAAVVAGASVSRSTVPIAAADPTEIVLARGERKTVPGTGVAVEAESVLDMTSRGCLGGPVACRDAVDLVVARGGDREPITLVVPHTEPQRFAGQHRGEAFGYRFELRKLEDGSATLAVQPIDGEP